MMHGPEKSDPAIVAGKPTNKAERSAAELVEPRAGTKGTIRSNSPRSIRSSAPTIVETWTKSRRKEPHPTSLFFQGTLTRFWSVPSSGGVDAAGDNTRDARTQFVMPRARAVMCGLYVLAKS
jgi:hypothetical protein